MIAHAPLTRVRRAGTLREVHTIGAAAYYVVVMLVYLGTDLLAAWGLNLEFGVAGVVNFAYIVLVAAAPTSMRCSRSAPRPPWAGSSSTSSARGCRSAAAVALAALICGGLSAA